MANSADVIVGAGSIAKMRPVVVDLSTTIERTGPVHENSAGHGKTSEEAGIVGE